MPVTLIVSRPDGVEHRRIALDGPGPRRPRRSRWRSPARRMTGTWRAKLHADPKADPLAQVVVPGRGLRARAPRPEARAAGAVARAGGAGDDRSSPAAISMARRPPISPSRARSSSSRRTRTSRAIPGYPLRPRRREARRPCASRSKACRATDADGDADVAVTLPRVPRTARPLEADILAAPARARRPHHRAHASRCRSICKQPRIGIKPLFKGDEVAGRRDGPLRGDRCSTPTASRAADADLQVDARPPRARTGSGTAATASGTTRRSTLDAQGRDGTADDRRRQPAPRSTPSVDWGRYRLEVTTADGDAVAASVALQRRLVRRRGRRQPRDARGRARQADLQGGRDGAS